MYHVIMSRLSLDDVRNAAARVAREHGVGEMYVYGSVARGNNRDDSDVDMIFKMKPGRKAAASTVLSIKDDLQRQLDEHRVSLLSLRTLLFNAEHSVSGQRFYESIKSDMKRVV